MSRPLQSLTVYLLIFVVLFLLNFFLLRGDATVWNSNLPDCGSEPGADHNDVCFYDTAYKGIGRPTYYAEERSAFDTETERGLSQPRKRGHWFMGNLILNIAWVSVASGALATFVDVARVRAQTRRRTRVEKS
jgi:hypothetical protein